MALYLIIHEPADENAVVPPSRLAELAADSVAGVAGPRWLTTWSPDLHDDRLFSLWEAENAAAIAEALERYGFLNERVAHPIRVRAWGPEDVLAAEQGD